MERRMNEKIITCLDCIIHHIQSSKEYQNCLLLKTKMDHNLEVMSLIQDIKKLQKLYVQSHYQDEEVHRELDEKLKRLNSIPLYISYNQNLEVVNSMIDVFKDEMNDYFYQQFNVLK